MLNNGNDINSQVSYSRGGTTTRVIRGHFRILSTPEGIYECTEALIRQLSSFGRSEYVKIVRKSTTVIIILLNLNEVDLASEILNKKQNICTIFII